MPSAFVAEPACAVCGRPASHVELHPDDAGWRFVYSGPGGGNGSGDIISNDRGRRLSEAFGSPPYRFVDVALTGLYDDAGFCEECEVPYCPPHWNISSTGFGRCPNGHGKSLDPHWSPE